MIRIELKETVSKKKGFRGKMTDKANDELIRSWSFNIEVENQSPDFMASSEFKMIADVIGSACNQINEIRKTFESQPDISEKKKFIDSVQNKILSNYTRSLEYLENPFENNSHYTPEQRRANTKWLMEETNWLEELKAQYESEEVINLNSCPLKRNHGRAHIRSKPTGMFEPLVYFYEEKYRRPDNKNQQD